MSLSVVEGFTKLFFCSISVFSRFQNPHLLLISSSFEFAQALILTKISGFAKPSGIYLNEIPG